MIKNYYQNIILYDFLSKNNIKNFFQLIKIKKIYINIGFKNIISKKEKVINSILFLKLITNQKSKITKSKKNNIFLKIKKDSIVGCKITLQKKSLNIFLDKIFIFILPKINNNIIINKKKEKTINFKISNILDFFEFQKEFLKFQDIPFINISIRINNNNYDFLLFYYLLINNKAKIT